jgi:hypothetical protein
MVLWFTKDNPQYLAAEYRLQTLRSDLSKMKFEYKHIEERLAQSEHTLVGLDYSLDYLRNNADIVSMREFQTIMDQRAYALHAVLVDRKSLPTAQSQIRLIEGQIQRLECEIPHLKSKVLEFKRDQKR